MTDETTEIMVVLMPVALGLDEGQLKPSFSGKLPSDFP
jgi:hypothetical protein